MTPVRPDEEVTGTGAVNAVDEGSTEGEDAVSDEEEQVGEAGRGGQEAEEVRIKRAPNQPSEKELQDLWQHMFHFALGVRSALRVRARPTHT